MSVLLPMGAGQSQRRRVTDLMFSTQVAIFCLVQYTIMVSIGDCTDDYPSCHTAWYRTKLRLSYLVFPPL